VVLKVVCLTLAMPATGRRQNLGDAVIHLGIRNILRCALGPHEEEVVVDLAGEAPIPTDVDIPVVIRALGRLRRP